MFIYTIQYTYNKIYKYNIYIIYFIHTDKKCVTFLLIQTVLKTVSPTPNQGC